MAQLNSLSGGDHWMDKGSLCVLIFQAFYRSVLKGRLSLGLSSTKGFQTQTVVQTINQRLVECVQLYYPFQNVVSLEVWAPWLHFLTSAVDGGIAFWLRALVPSSDKIRDIDDITWPRRDTYFIFECWWFSQERVQRMSERYHEKIKFVSPSGHVMCCLLSGYWWNIQI